MSTAGQQFVLRVADDGVGLPAGLDVGQTESLGLQLVFILAKQLHATVEATSKDGTVFVIAFPFHPEHSVTA
jgi:two-component system, sensor histidine kinase PdtaS